MTHAFTMLVLSGSAVVIAGILLGHSADRIANVTGLGEMWTGWVLLAAATSLPEFVTDVSAVRLNSANLAAGDLFGSSLTNMAILAVLALVPFAQTSSMNSRGVKPVSSQGHEASSDLLNAWFAILLTLLGAAFVMVHTGLGVYGLRPESASLLLIWIAGTRVLYSRQQQQASSAVIAIKPTEFWRRRELYRPALVFAAGSAIIFLVAPTFASCARQFAALSGWGESFVGTWVLGFSTALPELVTSMTACRLGAFDLAVANLYGSCAFNMVMFFAMDLASPRSVFSLLDPVLALSGMLTVVLMFIGMAAIAYRRRHTLAPSFSGGVLLASYGFALWIIYLCR
jgi:cation:H+ antiporter